MGASILVVVVVECLLRIPPINKITVALEKHLVSKTKLYTRYLESGWCSCYFCGNYIITSYCGWPNYLSKI